MEAKQKEQLMACLKHAIELEKQVYIQQDIIGQYEKACSVVVNSRPSLTSYPKEPSQVTQYDRNQATPQSGDVALWLLILFCSILMTFGAIYSIPFFTGDDVGDFLLLILVLIITGATDWFCYRYYIGWAIDPKKELEQKIQRYESELPKWKADCESVDRINAEKNKAYNDRCARMQNAKSQCMPRMRSLLSETQTCLQNVYGKGLIYPKYCNLPALTSIYEYFVTGRCDELTGPNGAYNMYEDEVRKDAIISKLDTIIANLEQIKAGQYMLYQQVSEIVRVSHSVSNDIRRMADGVSVIAQLSALNAYYNGVQAANTSIIAWNRSF